MSPSLFSNKSLHNGSEESLPFLSDKPSPRSAHRSSFAAFIRHSIICGVVLAVGFVFGSILASSRGSHGSIDHEVKSHSGRVISRVPDLPIVSKTFDYQRLYAGAPSNESNAAWEALIPQGRGFVDLLSADLFDDKEEVLAVSVFHQLHCLYILREGYYSLATGNSSSQSHAHRRDESHTDAVYHEEHMIHCFDYLRQALMCASDATLEPVDPESLVTDGWGAVHQCRDFDSLFEWSEENSKSRAAGIGNGLEGKRD